MPSTHRANMSWKSKELHDAAKRWCAEQNPPTDISKEVQRHFRRLTKFKDA